MLETQITNNGWPRVLVSDSATGSLYLHWIDNNSSSSMPWMTRADQNVVQTSGFVNGPFDGNIVIGTTGVYVSKYGGNIWVNKYAKDLSTKTTILDFPNPVVGDIDELSGLVLSSDEKTLFVTGRINMYSNYQPTSNILIEVDIASGGVNTTDLGPCYGAAPTDLAYDPSLGGSLYAVVQDSSGYSIIKINPTTGAVTPLITDLIGGGGGTDDHAHLTVDVANGRLYVSHMASQPDTVGVWDLTGGKIN